MKTKLTIILALFITLFTVQPAWAADTYKITVGPDFVGKNLSAPKGEFDIVAEKNGTKLSNAKLKVVALAQKNGVFTTTDQKDVTTDSQGNVKVTLNLNDDFQILQVFVYDGSLVLPAQPNHVERYQTIGKRGSWGFVREGGEWPVSYIVLGVIGTGIVVLLIYHFVLKKRKA